MMLSQGQQRLTSQDIQISLLAWRLSNRDGGGDRLENPLIIPCMQRNQRIESQYLWMARCSPEQGIATQSRVPQPAGGYVLVYLLKLDRAYHHDLVISRNY